MNIKSACATAAIVCLLVCASLVPRAAAQSITPQKQKVPIPFTAAGSKSMEFVVTYGPTVPVSALAFSPDGKRLAVGGYHEVVVWDLEHGKFLKRIGAGQLGTVGAIAFLKDGVSLAIGEGTPHVSGSVRIFNLENGQQTHSFDEPTGVVYALAVSPDGKLLVAGGGDKLARVWTIDDRKLVTTLKEHDELVSGVTFSQDGKLLATASAEKTVQVWEVETWTRKIKFREKEPVYGAVFGSDAKMVFLAVAGPSERSIRCRRTDNIRYTRAYSTGAGMPTDIAWAAKTNRMYVPCSDGIVKAYDTNGRLLASLAGDSDWVYGVAISDDGAKLASGSGDGTVKLWNLADNKLLATFVQLAPGTDKWVIVTSQGYMATSGLDAGEWKGENVTTPPDGLKELLQKPELVKQTIAGDKVEPPAIQ